MYHLLDTDICIKLLRGNRNVHDYMALIGEDTCFISEVTLAELRYGAEFSQRPAYHHGLIDDFRLTTRVFPIRESIPIFATEKARLRRAGLLIPDFDLLIGATAITHNFTLITNNTEHLSRMQGIRIKNWLTTPPTAGYK